MSGPLAQERLQSHSAECNAKFGIHPCVVTMRITTIIDWNDVHKCHEEDARPRSNSK
jgi:hypothetical protein